MWTTALRCMSTSDSKADISSTSILGSRRLDTECMERLMGHDDVQRVQTDMCQFDMVARIGCIGSELGAVLKPTGFLTDSPCIARELARRCPRDHSHVLLVAWKAARAAIYPTDSVAPFAKALQLRFAKTPTKPSGPFQ